jgi:hypothetical protein
MFMKKTKAMLLVGGAWIFLHFSCTQLPPQVAYVPGKVQIGNFIKTCFAGDVNGTTTSHVNYTAKVQIEIKGSGGLVPVQTNTVNSVAGPDKSMLEIPIDLPRDVGFKMTVWVDATECSKCNEAFCNTRTIIENGISYTVDAGKPYWSAEGIYQRAPTSGILVATPGAAFRYPNGPQPNDCNCKIKN